MIQRRETAEKRGAASAIPDLRPGEERQLLFFYSSAKSVSMAT